MRAPATRKDVQPADSHRRFVLPAAAVIALAACAAYLHSFTVPFMFDDTTSIVDNPTIRDIGNLGAVFSPPVEGGGSVNSRPVVNLSLAINYAFGKTDVRGYHAFNIALHALSGIALLGVVRRTLLGAVLKDRFGACALPISFGSALLWTLHPLQTETVTCVIQRTEGLLGLFYLLTFYCFIRSAGSVEPGRARTVWAVLAVVCCLLGAGSKEVMATCPILLLLYDRTFVAGSLREAWTLRRSLFLSLASSWLLLAFLVGFGSQRGGTVGFGLGTSSWNYLLTQFQAVAMYLKLSFWPSPLVLDYGVDVVQRLVDVWPQALLMLALGAATAFAVWRRPAVGFLGAWFFVIIAPSSSILPLTSQTMAEHRMYLPLAALSTAAAAGIHSRLGRRSLPIVAAVAAALGAATWMRNADYRDELSIWSDTVAKRPGNARARNNLSTALLEANRVDEAIAEAAEAARLAPGDYQIHVNYGNALFQAGRTGEATREFQTALQFKPGDPVAHRNLGNILARAGRNGEAVAELERALELRPDFVAAHVDLGIALDQMQRFQDAVRHFQEALRIEPENALAHYNWGNVLLETGQFAAAIQHYEAALRIRPGYDRAEANLAQARRLQSGR